jgi:predicted  nucleic acid-binding Zn-ribbon protein
MKQEELLQLKNKIEKLKVDNAEKKGRRKQLVSDLKNKWGCGSLKEAKNKLKKMEHEIKTVGEDISKRVEEIEEELNGTF